METNNPPRREIVTHHGGHGELGVFSVLFMLLMVEMVLFWQNNVLNVDVFVENINIFVTFA